MSIRIEQVPSPAPGSPESTGHAGDVLLDVSGMSKSFGGLAAVADLDLQIKRGQIYSIIGPNGAGKTTVFNVITGIYRPTRVATSGWSNAGGYLAMLMVNTFVGIIGRYLLGLAVGAFLGYLVTQLFGFVVNQAVNSGYGVALDSGVGLLIAAALTFYLLPQWQKLRGRNWGSGIAVGEALAAGLLAFFLLLVVELAPVALLAVFLIVTGLIFSLWVRLLNPHVERLLVQAENTFHPYQGKILLRGRELIGLSPDQVLRQGVARTFQNIRLFNNMTVLENVLVGQHARMKAGLFASIIRLPSMIREEDQARQNAIELLRFFGETLVERKDDPASSLSYADRRRVEVARALASNPELLLLDEPTAGMNEAETAEAVQYIRRLRDERGLTILLIEHKLTVTMGISDQISVLDYGRKIAEGLPEDIRRDERVIEAYLGRKGAVSDA